jgi:hypothetical protein
LHSSDTIDLVENQADSPEVVVVFQRDPKQASMKPVRSTGRNIRSQYIGN